MFLGVQIVGILFGLFMAYYTFLNYKRKEIKVNEFVVWMLGWLSFIVLTMFPNSLDFAAKTLNISRTLDFLTILGFLVLLLLTYHNYFVTKKNQKKIEAVVRKIAIDRANK